MCDLVVPYSLCSKLITRIISLGSSHLGATQPQHRQSSQRGTPLKFGWNRGWVALLRKPAISLKRAKKGPRLLLMTNRKSHSRFRLVPKSMTLAVESSSRNSKGRVRALNESGVGKIRDFMPISRRISQTVQGRTKVIIND